MIVIYTLHYILSDIIKLLIFKMFKT